MRKDGTRWQADGWMGAHTGGWEQDGGVRDRWALGLMGAWGTNRHGGGWVCGWVDRWTDGWMRNEPVKEGQLHRRGWMGGQVGG